MGIISKIKSFLGVAGDGRERPRDRGRTAGVDDEPETSSERAVKGVDRGADRGATVAGAETSTGERETSAGEPDTTTNGPAGSTDEQGVAASEPSGAAAEPVDSIKGIGAAYAQRLADAGIDSVAELARADPGEIAEATDLGTGRVGKWIERARARTD